MQSFGTTSLLKATSALIGTSQSLKMLGVFGLSDMPPFCCDHRVKKMAKKTLEQKPVGRICENRCENRGTFSNVFVIPWHDWLAW